MKEITKLSDKELLKALDEKRTALKDFRLGSSGGKLKDVKAGRNARKDIARILTEVTARNNKPVVAIAAPKVAPKAAPKAAAKPKAKKATK